MPITSLQIPLLGGNSPSSKYQTPEFQIQNFKQLSFRCILLQKIIKLYTHYNYTSVTMKYIKIYLNIYPNIFEIYPNTFEHIKIHLNISKLNISKYLSQAADYISQPCWRHDIIALKIGELFLAPSLKGHSSMPKYATRCHNVTHPQAFPHYSCSAENK